MKTRYETLPMQTAPGRYKVVRFNAHYPRGVMVAKFRSRPAAMEWMGRQAVEDVETRMRHVAEYLAERKARPAPILVDDGQGNLF